MSPELKTNPNRPLDLSQNPNVHEVAVTMAGMPYQDYWQEFASLCSPYDQTKYQAEYNAHKLNGLSRRMIDRQPSGDAQTDSWSLVKVAKAWYSTLGSLNPLNGADPDLGLAASIILAGNSQAEQHTNQQLIGSSLVEILSDHENRVANYVNADDQKLVDLSIVGQILLDQVKSTRTSNEHAWNLVSGFNDTIVSVLIEKAKSTGLSPDNKRVLSDCLKAKHAAQLGAFIQMECSGGSIDSVDSRAEASNKYLDIFMKQIKELEDRQNYMTNGDVNEHYFILLLNYALNISNETIKYAVYPATRRQDQPSDGFARNNLPRYSIDAIIEDLDATPLEYVQLKVSNDLNCQLEYAPGIKLIDNMLSEVANPKQRGYTQRQEMLKGLRQMKGLVGELIDHRIYEGSSAVFDNHLAAIKQGLQSSVI